MTQRYNYNLLAIDRQLNIKRYIQFGPFLYRKIQRKALVEKMTYI